MTGFALELVQIYKDLICDAYGQIKMADTGYNLFRFVL
jgi:hypothetical protein